MEKTDFFKNLGEIALFLMIIIRIFVSILSNFIFSFKGKQLKEIIERLRNLASNLDTNNILNRELKINRYYFYLSFGFQASFSVYFSLYFGDIFFYAFFEELFLFVPYYLSEFYAIYLTTYLSIIQEFFNSHLKQNYSKLLTCDDINQIKKNFVEIQSLINKINKLLSPTLLLICGILAYEIMNSFYFTFFAVKYIDSLPFSDIIPAIIGLTIALFRLSLLCFITERITLKAIIKFLLEFMN